MDILRSTIGCLEEKTNVLSGKKKSNKTILVLQIVLKLTAWMFLFF